MPITIIYATLLHLVVIAICNDELGRISILDKNSESEFFLGEKVALDAPKPLEVSRLERSVLMSFKHAYNPSKSMGLRSILKYPKLKDLKYNSIDDLRLQSLYRQRKNMTSVPLLNFEDNGTSVSMNNNPLIGNHTLVEDDDSDELTLPPYVEEQEEEELGTSTRGMLERMMKRKEVRMKNRDIDKEYHERGVALPSNLNVKIKVAYDQSFSDLITQFNLSPAVSFWYLTKYLKKIFDFPGLGTKIHLDVSRGNSYF